MDSGWGIVRVVWLKRHVSESQRRKKGGFNSTCAVGCMGSVAQALLLTPPSSFPASENDLLNKRLKLDYEEITPCLKEVTTVWEKMLSAPGRP